MKVLFYSSYHFNADSYGPYLELMQEHLNNGDEVHFLVCDADLSSCQPNPYHSKLICETCISMRKSGIAALNGDIKSIRLRDVLAFENVNPHFDLIDYSSVKALKDVKIGHFDIGMAVISSLVSITRDPIPDLIKHNDLIEKQWHSSMYVYESTSKLITDHLYDRVYVFNARHATLRACLRACQSLKTDCFVIEAGRNQQTYSVFPNCMPHDKEHIREVIEDLWEKGDPQKEFLAEEYYRKRRAGKDERFGFFTANQTKGKLPADWNENITNIAVFVSSEDEFVAIGKEWENHIYKSQTDGIRQISKSLEGCPDIKLYVRIHPNLKGILNRSIEEFYELKNQNTIIIPAESDVSTYALMQEADKTISFGSAMGIETTAAGKISISAGQSFYLNLGSTFNPGDHAELMEMLLDKSLEAKPVTGALKFAHYLLNFGYEYKYYKYHNPFEGEVNGKIFRPALPFYMVRRIGRWMRIRKERKQKAIATQKLRLME